MLPSMFSASAPADLAAEFAASLATSYRPPGFRAMARAAAEADLRDVLPTIDVPTVILHGDLDVRAPREVAEALRAAIPGSRLTVLAGVGHASCVESPERFTAELQGFLNDEEPLRSLRVGRSTRPKDVDMTAAPGRHLEPLQPLIGQWQSSGTVFGEDGAATGQIAGTDTYSWAPGGHWVLHEVDVTMDGERTQLLELIGGRGGPTVGRCMPSVPLTARRSCASPSRTTACCSSRVPVCVARFVPGRALTT